MNKCLYLIIVYLPLPLGADSGVSCAEPVLAMARFPLGPDHVPGGELPRTGAFEWCVEAVKQNIRKRKKKKSQQLLLIVSKRLLQPEENSRENGFGVGRQLSGRDPGTFSVIRYTKTSRPR